jgi:hypothetical protein
VRGGTGQTGSNGEDGNGSNGGLGGQTVRGLGGGGPNGWRTQPKRWRIRRFDMRASTPKGTLAADAHTNSKHTCKHKQQQQNQEHLTHPAPPATPSLLTSRSWVALRRKPPSARRVAVLLYGFPPGVGATGTAALLNVPKSLEAALGALRQAGYDLGPSEAGARGSEAAPIDGEAIVAALKGFEEGRVISGGAAAVEKKGAGAAAAFGARAVGAEVTAGRLKELLSFPSDWGPTEWGASGVVLLGREGPRFWLLFGGGGGLLAVQPPPLNIPLTPLQKPPSPTPTPPPNHPPHKQPLLPLKPIPLCQNNKQAPSPSSPTPPPPTRTH